MYWCVAVIPGYNADDLLEHALPQRVSLLHRIALVGHADLRQAIRVRKLERVLDDPVHALVGVDLFLDRNLVVRAGLEAPADAHVDAFGVLAEHHEIDVLPPAILERAQAIVEQAHRPVVDVEIELEARAKQNVARVAVVGDARIAERADEDRVELAQHLVAVGGQRLAGLQVVIGAPRQVLEIETAAERVSDGLQDFDSFRRDVLPDAVSRNDRYTHSIAMAIPIPPLTQPPNRPIGVRAAPKITTSRAVIVPIISNECSN